MAKILLVEDDTALAQTMLTCLRTQGQHTVDWVDNGNKAQDYLNCYEYELLILDWDLPEKSGIQILEDYRNRGGMASALFVTGKSALANKTQGLDAGADDYLVKPFELEELKARVRAVLRRGTSSKTNLLNSRDVTIDSVARTVKKGGELIHLTTLEFSLLEFLMRHKGQVFSPEALLNRVWDTGSEAGPDMVRTMIKRIRNKLADPEIIRTVFGEGYIVDRE